MTIVSTHNRGHTMPHNSYHTLSLRVTQTCQHVIVPAILHAQLNNYTVGSRNGWISQNGQRCVHKTSPPPPGGGGVMHELIELPRSSDQVWPFNCSRTINRLEICEWEGRGAARRKVVNHSLWNPCGVLHAMYEYNHVTHYGAFYTTTHGTGKALVLIYLFPRMVFFWDGHSVR